MVLHFFEFLFVTQSPFCRKEAGDAFAVALGYVLKDTARPLVGNPVH